ncbi:tetratricopeptide repeat protein [Leadbettera azotonutricia]|uniref:Tetratricopeptide repeat protein n=1 Tax=Leadbettera azotonutricia (strain ATCC BAA-888 / DSM 13862 / ZAS-9) TaxID=545695 RepID=F5YCJ5_LEAAZ|nr:tetratricopeptide repeat protein [Leadbettera azotonutricia]AEF82973.1 tetratricopeptide repeat protein [Leadbettera azotonutricia ZAS-9]
MTDARKTNQIEERQIRVFISSTFRDMQAERDYLVMKIFPSIRRYCEERDISFLELDLRWGISEEESKQGKVVDICLKEIEKTTPFFIGLLGERYGWVPSPEERRLIRDNTGVFTEYPWVGGELDKGASITEMEIQQGVLRIKEKINAYFYFRSPEMETPAEFREDRGSPAKKKLSALKKTLRKKKDYPVKDYRSIENLGEMIEKDFKTLVDTLWPQGALSLLEKERLEQKAFLKSRTNVYVPNGDTLQKLDDFANASGEEADRTMVVTGKRGMGKSALIANWIQRRKKQHDKIVYHFIGNSISEGDYRKISERLINEITQITGLPPDEDRMDSDAPKGADNLKDNLQNLLWTAAKKEKLILVLDGMDKLADIDNAKLLNWLPAFPPNVHVVFSTQPDDKTMEVFKRRNYPCIEVETLPMEERKTLITDYLASYAKKLKPEQIERIIRDKESENTLALRVLLDELRVFGVHEEIDARLNVYLSAQNLEDFYDMVVDRLEKTYCDARNKDGHSIPNFTGEVLGLLVSSRAGLSESEILGITKAAPLYWSQLYNGMSGHLSKRNGLIVFDNWFIQEAVTKRMKDGGEEYRRRIVSYMETASDIASNRKSDELSRQYFDLKEWDKMYAFLLDFDVFDYIYRKNEYELGEYWHALQKENKEKYSPAKYLDLEKDGTDREAIRYYYNDIGNFVSNVLADYVLALEFHQKALAICKKVLVPEHPNTASLYNNIGIIYSRMGNHEKALEFHQKALAIEEKVLVPEHPSTASSYSNIGVAYGNMGNHEKALEFHQKALAIREKVLVPEHPDTALSYGNIGGAYGGMGNHEKALEFHQKALAIREKVLGLEHPDTASSYNNIGGTYSDMGNHEKALEFHQKALAIFEKVLVPEHPDTALSYSNIGMAYSDMGNHEKALEFSQKALAIREKVLVPEHLDTASSYNNIGGTYSRMGNHEKALEFHQKALAIREKVLVPEHPDTALSYGNIGAAYSRMGNHEKALEFHQKALAIEEKVLVPEHPSIASSYNNIGVEYGDMGNHEKALEFSQKALAIREKVLVPEHPDTASSYNNIGGTYSRMGNHEKALEFHQKALAIREKVLVPEHPSTASSYSNIGVEYGNMGNHEKALEFSQKALAIREKVLVPEHPDTALSYGNIGAAYSRMGNHEKALEFHQKALAIEEKVLVPEHPSIASSYNNIGVEYSDMGNHEKALEFHQKALAIREKVLVPEHPSIASSYNNIGVEYSDMGNHEKALEFHQKALAIREKVLVPEHPSTASSYSNIGVAYGRMGNHEKALEFHQKALAIFEKVLGKDHPDTVKVVQCIADLHKLIGEKR